MTAGVKGTPGRAYDSSRRRAAAEERRRHVLDAALEQFLRDGYGATTVAAVAEAAEVSVETVYKSFGGKSGLALSLVRRALEGGQAEPAELRSDRLRTLEDPHEIVAGWARLATEVAPRTVPLLLVLRSAAVADPAVQPLLDRIEESRYRRMTDNARALHRGGHLRTGLPVRAAADVLFAVSSAEMYELLVLRRRWSVRRYGDYVRDTIAHALLATA
jgi:AcrR family transcriptional regulator